MRPGLHGGGHIFPSGEVSVLQGSAGQKAWQGGLLHCGAHLALCRVTAAGVGCSTSSDIPPMWSWENRAAASSLSLLFILDLIQNFPSVCSLKSCLSAALSCFQSSSESTVREKRDQFLIDNSYL